MADEQQGRAGRQDLADLCHRLGLERRIADGKGLVHDQDVRIGMHLHREGQAQGHAGTVGLDRLVDELADVGELDDAAHAFAHLRRAQAQDGGIDAHVLAAGQLWIEAGPELQQGRDPAIDAHVARGRLEYARHDLQQRALAAAVMADDAQGFAAPQRKTDRLQRLVVVHAPLRASKQPRRQRWHAAQQHRQPVQ